jgi:hypothetical protein
MSKSSGSNSFWLVRPQRRLIRTSVMTHFLARSDALCKGQKESLTNLKSEPVRAVGEISWLRGPGRSNAVHAVGSGSTFKERVPCPSVTMVRDCWELSVEVGADGGCQTEFTGSFPLRFYCCKVRKTAGSPSAMGHRLSDWVKPSVNVPPVP